MVPNILVKLILQITLPQNSQIISQKSPNIPLELISQTLVTMLFSMMKVLIRASQNRLFTYFFLCEGTLTVKYVSVELVKVAGIINSIEIAFNPFGITSFTDIMLRLNLDGAIVNVGVYKGVRTQLMKKDLWLQVIQCFNHSWTST